MAIAAVWRQRNKQLTPYSGGERMVQIHRCPATVSKRRIMQASSLRSACKSECPPEYNNRGLPLRGKEGISVKAACAAAHTRLSSWSRVRDFFYFIRRKV